MGDQPIRRPVVDGTPVPVVLASQWARLTGNDRLILLTGHRSDGGTGLFRFYSPDFTGIGHSVEDCLYKARWGMQEQVALLKEQGVPVPPPNPDPTITIQNEHRAA